MRFITFLLLTLWLAAPVAHAKQPITPQLSNYINAMDRIAFCSGLKSAEMMQAFEQNVAGTLSDKGLEAVISSKSEQTLAFAGATNLYANFLTAALIVDDSNVFNEIIRQQEQRTALFQEKIGERFAKGADLSAPLKDCDEEAKAYDEQLSKKPNSHFLFLLDAAEQQKAQALLGATLSDTRCALIAHRAKSTYGTDEHAMVTLFDSRRKVSFESYRDYLEEIAPSKSSETLEKLAVTKLSPHLQSLSSHWDEIDDAAKKEWVGHCRQIQKSLE